VLFLHRSARADQLVAALGRELSRPLADPIQAEIVSVPTRGVERWITQRLSHVLGAGDDGAGGICANVDFPFPGVLVGQAVAQATGVDPSGDPWAPERAVWPLIEIIDGRPDDPELSEIQQHLAACTPDGPPRRYALARHLADLFDRYGVHRPEMLQGWARRAPETSAPLGWQHHLWRLLRDHIGLPSPAERLPEATAAISGDEVTLDLPARLGVFGLTRLPQSHLQVLSAVGSCRDVHLYLLHPSGALWDRLADAADHAGPLPFRRDDRTRLLPAHPLLRSWGHDAREMQLVLAHHGVAGGEHLEVPEPPRPSLLGRIQDGLRHDRAPGPEAAVIDAGDDSIRVYPCHGRTRQVEVLRDAILHRLADDPTLEPRDVIVMCPDIEAFAPLIQAAFGESWETGEASQLRVRLADRSIRQTNPLLAVASRVLELASSRVSASEVIDLASRPPVARRFRFDREELATIERWVADTEVHWGFDSDHRGRWDLADVPEGTWSAGLDRLLVGVAMADEDGRMFGETVPYGDLPSSSVELAGRLAELVERLRSAVLSLQRPQPVTAWADALLLATQSLAAPPPDEAWQLEQLRSTLADAADEADQGPAGRTGWTDLSLEEVRSLLSARLAGQPTRANFRTGDLTFCTLVPMRSVPHRVVALLGLDDGEFPRHPNLDGDDLLLRDPIIGEREARAEDRQLLLDALLAATDHFVVTYSGRDERTNRVRPPCAPIAEFLDLVGATAVTPDGVPAAEAVLVEQPLQPYDRVNFTRGRLGREGPWSFDRIQLAGAEAVADQRPAAPWLAEPLDPLVRPVVSLEGLVNFVQHPVKAFLRQRLDIFLTDRDSDLSDEIPLVLTELDKWDTGDRLLDAALTGVPLDVAAASERRRGTLPPAAISRDPLTGIVATVEHLIGVAGQLGLEDGPAASKQVRVPLTGDRVLSGSIPGVRGVTIAQFVYSKLAAKHRLAAWVRYLALTAERPDLPVRAVSVGRAAKFGTAVAWLDPYPGSEAERRAWAVAQLRLLVALHDLGLTRPLPIMAKTSCAWAEGRADRLDDLQLMGRAEDQWSSKFPEEDDDHRYVWGRSRPLIEFLAEQPRPDEQALGWPVGERSRFGGLARILWDPILVVERRETQ
jgi:exodeoxyribonuclease V gamma subunit